MKRQESPKLWILAIILAFVGLSATVSHAQSEDLVASAPTVTATSPVNHATAVNLNQAVGVTFSQPMSALSVGSNLFVLRPGGSA